ncbi:MAG: FtsQ-type POTRA domain-containing protein [Gaiella sp.]|nr:FtsQ-type POTRA domain-containing protein [Gaiella sp.]
MRSASVVVPLPRAAPGESPGLGPFVPSGRSLLVAFAVLGGVLLALVLARETSLFAVRSIEVTGASPAVERQVERALRDRSGESLFAIDLGAARVDVASLPTVAGVSFDRAYPHTLRVTVVPERPVAVVRQGAASYLVSEHGRVMARVYRTAQRPLARIWVTRDVSLTPGAFVDGALDTAVRAVAPLAGIHFPSRVVSVRTTDGLTLRLRSGLELRLGDTRDVELKLAVADRVLRRLPAGSGYLDVSVPDRPVAGPRSLDPQVEVEPVASSGA